MFLVLHIPCNGLIHCKECVSGFFGVLIILAALLGAEVHSRLILGPGAGEGAQMPLRQVGGWWVHLAFVLLALAVNLVAFAVVFGAVSRNRKAIEEINSAA